MKLLEEREPKIKVFPQDKKKVCQLIFNDNKATQNQNNGNIFFLKKMFKDSVVWYC